MRDGSDGLLPPALPREAIGGRGALSFLGNDAATARRRTGNLKGQYVANNWERMGRGELDWNESNGNERNGNGRNGNERDGDERP